MNALSKPMFKLVPNGQATSIEFKLFFALFILLVLCLTFSLIFIIA